MLTQAEVLIALRLTSPQDRKAVEAWVSAHDAPDLRQEMLASLPSLPVGTAWVWSPGWLDVLVKARVRRRETFDSSATPKVGQVSVGQARAEPAALATVDLDRLRARLASVEGAAPEDAEPAELRRLLLASRERVAALERQIGTAQPVPQRVEAVKEVIKEVVRRVEVPALEAGQAEQLRGIASELTAKAGALRADADRLMDAAGSMTDAAQAILLRLDRIAGVPAPAFPAAALPALPEPAGVGETGQAAFYLEPALATPPPSSALNVASGNASIRQNRCRGKDAPGEKGSEGGAGSGGAGRGRWHRGAIYGWATGRGKAGGGKDAAVRAQGP